MARKERLFFENVAHHIGIQGINETPIFKDEEDYLFYIHLLKDLSITMRVALHAYALYPSGIHLLCTFPSKEILARFMQSLGLKYVSYFNKKYQRSGTIWQGRYKSSLVEDRYILDVMHYIETLNNARYSSYKQNILSQKRDFLKAHELYELLGKDEQDRASLYKSRVEKQKLLHDMVRFIEESLEKQRLTGTQEFYKKLEEIAGRTLGTKRRGRPKKEKSKGKKMFKKLVVLDKEKHKSLKISPLEDLKFAQDLGFIPLLVNEAAAVAETFPVVFTADETPSLVALTSLGGKNLAINSEGKYIVQYVPAFLRKYPFALAATEENPDQKVILIDEEASVLSKTKGKQLFTKDGSESEVLQNAVNFLRDYEQQNLNTQAVIKEIADSGILESKEISVGEGDDKKVLVNGFLVVNREKLNNLDDAKLAEWVRKGIISFLDAHLKSLSKIEVLFKLASQAQQN